jgi:lysophospholipase L1-like esterase
LVLSSVLISLLGLELLLRLALPYDLARKKEAETYFEMMYVDKNGYRQLKPNKKSRLTGIRGIDFTVSINSKGFRGRDFEYKKISEIGSIDLPIDKANNVNEAGITILNLNKKVTFDGFIRKLEVVIPKNGFKKSHIRFKVFKLSGRNFKEVGSSKLFKLQPGLHKLNIDNGIKVYKDNIIGMYVVGTTPAINKLKGRSKSYYIIGEKKQFSLDIMKSIPKSEKYAFAVSIQNNLSNNKTFLFVGDSFTFGYGVDNEHTFPYILNQSLQSQGINVINAGVTGWGGAEQKDFIKNKAGTYNPDIIFHSFYLNDIIDAYNNNLGKKDYVESYYKKKKIIEDYINEYDSNLVKADYFLNKNTYTYPFLLSWYKNIINKIDSYNYRTLGKTDNPEFVINNVGNKGITIIDLEKKININNKIYKYEVFSLVKTDITLKIWRKEKNGYVLIAKSKPKSIGYGRTRISLDEPILLKKGDFVGFYSSYSSLSNEKPIGQTRDVYNVGDVDFISNDIAKINTGKSGGYSLKIFMGKDIIKKDRSEIDKKDRSEIDKKEQSEIDKQGQSEIDKQVNIYSSAKNNKIHNKIVSEFMNNINNFDCQNHNNELLSFYCKKYNKKQKFIFDLAIDHILEMSKNSKDLDANFISFYLTPIYEFYENKVYNNEIDLSHPYRYLNKKLKQHGIKIYDIHLRSKNEKTFYIPDSHYNENGYQATAMKILDIIKKENLTLKNFSQYIKS